MWSNLPRKELGLIVAICAVVGLTILLDENQNYLQRPGQNALDLTRQTTMLGIFALGAAVVIIAGGIDLSSGSVIAFSGAFCACVLVVLANEQLTNHESLPFYAVPVAIGLTLLVGWGIGSLHAFLITRIKLPPFVATLATLVGLRSLGRFLVKRVTEVYQGGANSNINLDDETFRALGRNVWIPAVIFAVLVIGVWILMDRTVLGRHLYALGGNEEAARLSGIRTDRLKWFAYSFSAVLSSLAGILYVSYLALANPESLGRGYELNAIAAAVVGGCSLQGGVGTVPGTVLGVLFLRVVVDSVAKIITDDADLYEGMIVGVLVVLAVAFNEWQQRSGKRK